ncbi:MAG: alpha/beta fold hydrolase [Acidobacteriota bacterium]|nr:alpha/beta fold hydrolase [Acidobacteriota bacterium]
MQVVAFHGYPLDRRIWEPLAGRAQAGTLGPITAVFAPDFRGRGTSLRPAAPVHGMSLLADDMADEISRAVPPGETFLLAGLSMGGYVAFEFVKRHAARFRGRLLGLALFDTKASSDDDAGRAGRKAAIEAIRKDGIEAALSAMLPKLLARRSKGGPVEEIARAMILATPPRTAMADLAGLALRDEGFEVLSGWERPLLVIVGDEDAIAPPSDAEAMTAVAGRASWVSLVTVPRAGHLVPLEQPDETAAGLVSLAEAALRP